MNETTPPTPAPAPAPPNGAEINVQHAPIAEGIASPLPPPPQVPLQQNQFHQPPPAPFHRRLPLRTMIAVFAAVVSVVGVGTYYAVRTPPPHHAKTLGARLDLAAGDVVVEGSEGRALSGMPLATGATITTKKGARALVRTSDGAAVFLRSETTLKLLEHGIELTSGEIWVDAPRAGSTNGGGAAAESFAIKSGAYSVSASDAGIDVKIESKKVEVYVARVSLS